MNKTTLEGSWKTLKGKIRQQWAKLTDDDIEYAKGNFDEFVGRLETKHGYSKEQARTEFENFKKNHLPLFGDRSEQKSKPN